MTDGEMNFLLGIVAVIVIITVLVLWAGVPA